MPVSPHKKKSVNPIGVLGITLFGGLTMILTMLAILFFPLAGVLGSLLDILSSLNPFKKRVTGTKDTATQENSRVVETLDKT